MSDWRFLILIFLRRLPLFVFCTLLGAAVGITLALILPPVFRSEAVLSLDEPQLPGPEAEIRTLPAERLSLLRQRLLTRETLLELARAHGLPPDARLRSADEILRYMQAKSAVEISHGGGKPALMTIRFEARQPGQARALVTALVARVRQDDAALRLARAREALSFLNRDLTRLASLRAGQEAALRDFRAAHPGSLPEDLRPLQDQQAALQARLAQLAEAMSRETGAAALGPTGAVGLEGLRRQLTAARAVYSEVNPKIRLLRAQIAGAEAARATPPGGPLLALQAEEQSLLARAAELNARLEAIPAHQLALAALEREAAAIDTRYQAALTRQTRAAALLRATVAGQAGGIAQIEAPSLPSDPIRPHRLLIAALGLLAGLLAGTGLVAALEAVNVTVRRPADLVRQLGVVPIATIPHLPTRREVLQRRLRIAVSCGVAVAAIPAALVLFDLYFMPLDLLGQVVIERVGFRG